MKTQINTAIRLDVLRMTAEGKSRVEIAEALGIGTATVSRVRKLGVEDLVATTPIELLTILVQLMENYHHLTGKHQDLTCMFGDINQYIDTHAGDENELLKRFWEVAHAGEEV